MTGVQTCALPITASRRPSPLSHGGREDQFALWNAPPAPALSGPSARPREGERTLLPCSIEALSDFFEKRSAPLQLCLEVGGVRFLFSLQALCDSDQVVDLLAVQTSCGLQEGAGFGWSDVLRVEKFLRGDAQVFTDIEESGQ